MVRPVVPSCFFLLFSLINRSVCIIFLFTCPFIVAKAQAPRVCLPVLTHNFVVPSLSDDDDGSIVEGSSSADEADSGESDASELLDARRGDLDETEREFMERAEKIRRQEEEEEAAKAQHDPRPQPGDPDWDPELFYDSEDSENEVRSTSFLGPRTLTPPCSARINHCRRCPSALV